MFFLFGYFDIFFYRIENIYCIYFILMCIVWGVMLNVCIYFCSVCFIIFFGVFFICIVNDFNY